MTSTIAFNSNAHHLPREPINTKSMGAQQRSHDLNNHHHDLPSSSKPHTHLDTSDILACQHAHNKARLGLSVDGAGTMTSVEHDLAQLAANSFNAQNEEGSGADTKPADADDDPQGPFEGPEKLLELWFAPEEDQLPSTAAAASFSILRPQHGRIASPRTRKGLRAVSRDTWESMLDIVKCKVLSVVEGEHVDAYLLR